MAILVGGGTRIRIPAGGLVLGPDGGSARVELAYDTFPQWLMIAVGHAEECERLAQRVDALWDATPRDDLLIALEAEVRSAMQAIIASAAAIDGFYAFLCQEIPELRPSGRRGKSARWSRIAEAIKQSFEIRASTGNEIRRRLEAIFKLRDEAVHPTAVHQEPVQHPRSSVGVPRQFACFDRENAVGAVVSALAIIGGLIHKPKPVHRALKESCGYISARVAPAVARWEEKHPPAWRVD